jgi:hypothetical protein
MAEDKERAKCALSVWRHEDEYRSLIEALDGKDAEKAKHYLDALRKTFEEISKSCRIDVSEAKEKISDAEWHVDREGWLDAKWDVLFASSHVLDALKAKAKDE